jgi:hypothetical protein
MDPIKEKINQLRKLAIERKEQQQQQIQNVNEDNQLTSVCDTATNSSMVVDESESSLVVYDDKPEHLYETISDMASNIQPLQPTPPDTAELMRLVGTSVTPMSKYVNRIKDFYDKERTSSLESLGSKSVISQKKSKVITTPTTCNATPEIFNENTIVKQHVLNESDDETSVASMQSNVISRANRAPNKYINNLLNNFSAASNLRADSIENLKRNVDGEAACNKSVYNSSNQVDRLKEKFTKFNQPITAAATNQRLTTQVDSTMKSSNLDEKSKELDEIPELRFPVGENENVAQDPIKQVSNGSNRNPKKYQRSKTSDLSDVIFVKNDINNENESDKKEVNTLKKNEFDDLFSRYGVDKKYSTENAIIKSTMCLDRIQPSK